MNNTHTMSDTDMIEFYATVKDCLEYDPNYEEIELMRRHYLNGWMPDESAEYLETGNTPARVSYL